MYILSVYFQCFILFLEKWVKFDDKKFVCVLYVLCVENWNDIVYIFMNYSILKKLLYVLKFDYFYWNIVLCNKNEYKFNNQIIWINYCVFYL